MTDASIEADRPRGSSLARSTALMTGGTVISRLTGVVRLAVLAATLGVAETRLADTYNLANTAPNILYELVLGGVITSVFVPMFVELLEKEKRDDAWRSISAILNVCLVALAVLAVVGMLAAPLIARFYSSRLEGAEIEEQRAAITLLLRLLIPQVVLYGIYFITSAILNANRRFALPMYTPIINNLVLIAVLIFFRNEYGLVTLTSVTTTQLLVIGIGTTVSVAPMGLLLLPTLRRLGGYSFTLKIEPVLLKKLGKLSAYVIGFVAANQIGYVVVQWLANGTKGGYTAYIAAFTFFLLPIGLFVWSLTTAIVPSMSSHAVGERWDDFRNDVSLAVRAILFLMVPATVGFLALGAPLVDLLLKHGVVTGGSTKLIVDVLSFFVLGLVQFSVFQVLVRAFYATQDARTPFLINCVVVALNTAINIPMYYWIGVKGLAAGQAIAYTVGIALQAKTLGRRSGGFDSKRIYATAARVMPAAAGMGAVTWLAREGIERTIGSDSLVQQVITLGVPTAVGVASYLALATLFKVEEMSFVKGLLLRRPNPAAA
ncbi:MAG: putative peptidoglycan lipid flippase [Actinomycetota bacterium]|nr:putative peptidoglycan lipid flippase [Actinomycetota bacterium]